jgi:hypothetical protein
MIADSDHFSVVKPPSATHATHSFLYGFWYRFQGEFLKHSTPKLYKTPLLTPPAPSHPIIGRADVMGQIKQKLLKGESCALHGPAGIGKTSIAQTLVHDEELRATFPDGVLWGTLSADKDAGALFAAWSDGLGIPGASIAQLKRIDDRARAVANEVDQRRMLIVCNDCEEQETAVLVRMIGPNCVRLLTTRSPGVAAAFAGSNGAIEITPLSSADAGELLARNANTLRDDAETVAKIITLIGASPGEVSVIGNMLGGIKDPAKLKEIIRRLLEEKPDGNRTNAT